MSQNRLSSPVLVNLGSGESGAGRMPGFFNGWTEVRVDIDPSTAPDVLSSITDLSGIPNDYAAGVWASHCVEHLFQHEVAGCFREIRRVMNDRAFACIRVPDLQRVASVVAEDRLHEVLYTSPAGPVTAHDIVYGFGPDIARGKTSMAHRTGFTPSLLVESLAAGGFEDYVVRRRPQHLELVAIARKAPWRSNSEAAELFDALGL